MLCPKCSGILERRVSHGVTVDVCGECGGVWLDSGELDKLMMADEPAVLASSANAGSVQDGDDTPADTDASPGSSKSDHDGRDDDPNSGKKSNKEKKKRKRPKKGWADQLEDIFDDVLDFDLDDVFDFD